MFLHSLAKLGNKVCCPFVLQAQAVALTVAQAFTIAFELWQVAKEGRHKHPPHLGNQTKKKNQKTIPVCGGVVISVTETVFVLIQL